MFTQTCDSRRVLHLVGLPNKLRDQTATLRTRENAGTFIMALRNTHPQSGGMEMGGGYSAA